MNNLPSFKEDHISQIPALQMLCKLGYVYLSPEETCLARNQKTSNVLLEKILENQLRTMPVNTICYKGNQYNFSNSNITEAINSLKNIPYDGLVRTNELIYNLLFLGKSLEEIIQDNKRSFDLKYIDWENIRNNVYHVTEEFEVERQDGQSHRRPDVVLFVNGIPFVVIECIRPDIKEPIEQAISQHIRNQKNEEIPRLFTYGQLLIATCSSDVQYATVGTPLKFWTKWKERNEDSSNLEQIVNASLTEEQKENLFFNCFKYVREYFDKIEKNGRLVSEQDKIVYHLCSPERLLELTRKFNVFDGAERKITRHQQYFAVKNSISRVQHYEKSKKRKGGIIWHTQGSGKSITMVILAKALALETSISNPRVIIVTDRKNLDKQIRDTFLHCGMEPQRARSGKHLLQLLESEKNTIMTSVLFKFRAAVKRSNSSLNTENVFVLVDESHRSHYGSAHALMQKMLPGACYIGFTGTPLMKDEKKNTIEKFGSFIDTYMIDEATADKAVVPLLYEGRHNILKVNKEPINKWFNVVAEPLAEYQTADLKRKFTKKRRILSAEDNIRSIAYDISEHFYKNWQGTGFKGQLAVQSREDAIRYKNFFDEFGKVTTEIIISAPDDREVYEDVYDEEPAEEVQRFWIKMMNKYGDEEIYNDQIINDFKYDNRPEILIVVYKLLTGFDAPNNIVLYLAKELKEHTLLQAIARVNRVYEGKDFGYVIDYVGILEELDKAVTSYSALKRFDEEDLKGTLINIKEEIRRLPQKYSDLVAIFKDIKNKRDEEEYEQLLFDNSIRERFYDRLSHYSRFLGVALSSNRFYEECSGAQIEKYKQDFKFFQKLRFSVKRRYAEIVDFNMYERKVKKLLDIYVTSEEIIQITEQVNIFDKANFQREVEKVTGATARADMIAHRTRKTIEDKFNEDPVFYEKFAKLLQKAIDDFRHKRIMDAEYLNIVKSIMTKVIERRDDDVPEMIKDREVARAFYGIASRVISKHVNKKREIKETAAQIGIGIDDIIQKHIVVDWHLNRDVQNQILNELEDYLADRCDIKLSYDDIDLIMEEALKIAKIRYAQ